MTSLGETLRRARLQRNLELNRIADELKISASMLRAIEEERFDKLPGGVFARSFVRQYARLLEVDEDEIVGELNRVLDPPPVMPQLSHAGHVPDSQVPLVRVQEWQTVGEPRFRWSSLLAVAMVVVVILACAGAYAWWQRDRRPVASLQKTPVVVQTAPPVQSTPVAEPAAATEPPPEQPPPATPEPAAAPPAPAVSAAPAVTSEPAPQPAAQAAAAQPIPADANSDAPVRVEVIAEEQSWVSARADGQPSFSVVLEPNQSRTVAANKNVWLKVGNSGGVRVLLNGKPIGPLGAKGVVRTLQLTSGGFKIVPPDVPKPALPTDAPLNPL